MKCEASSLVEALLEACNSSDTSEGRDGVVSDILQGQPTLVIEPDDQLVVVADYPTEVPKAPRVPKGFEIKDTYDDDYHASPSSEVRPALRLRMGILPPVVSVEGKARTSVG